MNTITVKQMDAATVGSDNYQPYLYLVQQDGKTVGQFLVDEYKHSEEAKTAAMACADRYSADPWVSPFLSHRAILLADYGTAQMLRSLCLNLWNGNTFKVDMGSLLAGADSQHRAIAFDLLQGYALMGENDKDFMALCDEIRRTRNEKAKS